MRSSFSFPRVSIASWPASLRRTARQNRPRPKSRCRLSIKARQLPLANPPGHPDARACHESAPGLLAEGGARSRRGAGRRPCARGWARRTIPPPRVLDAEHGSEDRAEQCGQRRERQAHVSSVTRSARLSRCDTTRADHGGLDRPRFSGHGAVPRLWWSRRWSEGEQVEVPELQRHTWSGRSSCRRQLCGCYASWPCPNGALKTCADCDTVDWSAGGVFTAEGAWVCGGLFSCAWRPAFLSSRSLLALPPVQRGLLSRLARRPQRLTAQRLRRLRLFSGCT